MCVHQIPPVWSLCAGVCIRYLQYGVCVQVCASDTSSIEFVSMCVHQIPPVWSLCAGVCIRYLQYRICVHVCASDTSSMEFVSTCVHQIPPVRSLCPHVCIRYLQYGVCAHVCASDTSSMARFMLRLSWSVWSAPCRQLHTGGSWDLSNSRAIFFCPSLHTSTHSPVT